MRVYIASIGLCLLFLGSTSSMLSWAQCSPDTEPPAITGMPTNLVLTADAGDCGATATWSSSHRNRQLRTLMSPLWARRHRVTISAVGTYPGDIHRYG